MNFLNKFKKQKPITLKPRKIIQIVPVVTNLNINTQSDFSVIVLCDDDSIWMTNNREIHLSQNWKRLRDIPKY